MKHSFWAIALLAVAFVGCNNNKPTTDAVDYSNNQNWLQTGKEIDSTLLDVFYLIPTSGGDWVDENGVTHHHLDITNPDHRMAMEKQFNVALPIFGDSANLFSPYYRQITLQVWANGVEAVNKYYPKAFEDVKAAFDYYMEHWNGGREFILAGFSQGAKSVKELVKSMTDEQYARMKAAYVIGFPVLQEDLADTDRFKPAQGADDLGVTISYNSVDNEEGISNILRHSQMIINPANWCPGTEVAQVNDTVTNYINKEQMMLFVDGIDPDPIFHPEAAMLFPKGNFHMLELTLYANYLRENVKLRLYKK